MAPGLPVSAYADPYPGQVLAKIGFAKGYEYSDSAEEVLSLSDANAATSLVVGKRIANGAAVNRGRHKPLLDIDMPVTVYPSSTPGHHHLFIDREMSWDGYLSLMAALSGAGIIQHGFYAASRRRGFSSVRLPWIKK